MSEFVPPDKTTPLGSAGTSGSDKAERFKQATSDAVNTTHEKLDHAADRVEAGLHRGTDKVADAASSAGEYGRQAMDYASDWKDKACDYVRDNPTQSLVMALAAGWLIGRLMHRKHD